MKRVELLEQSTRDLLTASVCIPNLATAVQVLLHRLVPMQHVITLFFVRAGHPNPLLVFFSNSGLLTSNSIPCGVTEVEPLSLLGAGVQ